MPKTNPLHDRFQTLATHCSVGDYFDALAAPGLQDTVDPLWPAHRERLFPPIETVSMFVVQALSADGSCRFAVNQAAVHRLFSD